MRRESGSISAPARKVRRTAPKVARKLTHSLVCSPRKLPPITPIPISISATEMPVRIETRLATKASTIHAAATNQTLVTCASIGSAQPCSSTTKMVLRRPRTTLSRTCATGGRRCLGGGEGTPTMRAAPDCLVSPLLDRTNRSGRAHLDVLHLPKPRDQAWRAGWAVESPRLESARQGIERHGLPGREQLAQHGENLVRRRCVRRVGRSALRSSCRPHPPPSRPSASGAAVRRALPWCDLPRSHQRAVGEAMEIDAAARSHIADRIEGLVIRDDVEHIAWPRARQPDARRDRDAEIAPVLHPEGRRGMHQLRPVARQQAGGLVADHAPVADRHEARLVVEDTEPQVLEHARDVLHAARVLDVEDDGAPHRRRAPLRAYHTGTTKRLSQVELTRPPTITSAIGCSISPPARPPRRRSGTSAMPVVSAVMRMGARRSAAAATTAPRSRGPPRASSTWRKWA